MRTLGLLVAGAPLASRARDLHRAAAAHDWRVQFLPTTAAHAWEDYWGSLSPANNSDGRPDAIIVCPLTFNTARKWVLGIADTRPLSVLAESFGQGCPCIAVPMVNRNLWNHPVWEPTLTWLEAKGVDLVDASTGAIGSPQPLDSGTGLQIARDFQTSWVLDRLDATAPQ